MTTNYAQLDWSPVTWALFLGGMATAAVVCMSLAVLMAFRASQATSVRPAVAAVPTPEHAPAAPAAPAAVEHATAA
ncbi:hypothetical protein AB0N29_17830 [Nocardioides sp. NPDC092400]|uniref:hypothetical protein n=1 Tax=Nocardioides sp. NPDC092400 TaxID=3155196 RepID=UPI003413AD6B